MLPGPGLASAPWAASLRRTLWPERPSKWVFGGASSSSFEGACGGCFLSARCPSAAQRGGEPCSGSKAGAAFLFAALARSRRSTLRRPPRCLKNVAAASSSALIRSCPARASLPAGLPPRLGNFRNSLGRSSWIRRSGGAGRRRSGGAGRRRGGGRSEVRGRWKVRGSGGSALFDAIRRASPPRPAVPFAERARREPCFSAPCALQLGPRRLPELPSGGKGARGRRPPGAGRDLSGLRRALCVPGVALPERAAGSRRSTTCLHPGLGFKGCARPLKVCSKSRICGRKAGGGFGRRS